MDKSKFKDPSGNFVTQSLFIDFRYDSKYAVYTLAEEDKEYEGEVYPSLKRLYLEAEDPTEYEFANTHLYSWEHWQRLCSNAALLKHIEKWREELEVRLRAKAVRVLKNKASAGDFNAAKWVADRGWSDDKSVKKQTKAQKEKMRAKIDDELKEDAARVLPFVRKDA